MYNDGIPFEGDAVKYIQSLADLVSADLVQARLGRDGIETVLGYFTPPPRRLPRSTTAFSTPIQLPQIGGAPEHNQIWLFGKA